RAKLWPETSGTGTPLYLAKKNLYYLPQFKWMEIMRPTSPMDVFNRPPKMMELFAQPDPANPKILNRKKNDKTKKGSDDNPLPLTPESDGSTEADTLPDEETVHKATDTDTENASDDNNDDADNNTPIADE
ncbi:MAG: hypothetical protein K2M76_05275, partial [Muribaculaceae bacterium]|nr:hypothetical protein [Muribaculaceae bacterium]